MGIKGPSFSSQIDSPPSSFLITQTFSDPPQPPTPLLTDPSSLVSTALLIVLQHLDLSFLEYIPNQPLPPFVVPLYSPF
jgi:hypothetical protein